MWHPFVMTPTLRNLAKALENFLHSILKYVAINPLLQGNVRAIDV